MEIAKIDMIYGTENGNFDLVVVNDNLEDAYNKLENFLKENYPQLNQVADILYILSASNCVLYLRKISILKINKLSYLKH